MREGPLFDVCDVIVDNFSAESGIMLVYTIQRVASGLTVLAIECSAADLWLRW